MGWAGFFPQDFLPIKKKQRFFSHSPRAKIFFQCKTKTFFFFFFFLKYIYIYIYIYIYMLEMYSFKFIRSCIFEPNIQGYIVYMFLYTCILDIWVRVYMSCDMTKPTKWLCAQRRLRSAWASAQSDQSLRCPHEEALGP